MTDSYYAQDDCPSLPPSLVKAQCHWEQGRKALSSCTSTITTGITAPSTAASTLPLLFPAVADNQFVPSVNADLDLNALSVSLLQSDPKWQVLYFQSVMESIQNFEQIRNLSQYSPDTIPSANASPDTVTTASTATMTTKSSNQRHPVSTSSISG